MVETLLSMYSDNYHILIIDDNSPDNTWKKIQEYSKNKENIYLIIRNKKEGLDTAIVPGVMNIAMMSQLITSWTPNVRLKK